jgi:hypothetical protein
MFCRPRASCSIRPSMLVPLLRLAPTPLSWPVIDEGEQQAGEFRVPCPCAGLPTGVLALILHLPGTSSPSERCRRDDRCGGLCWGGNAGVDVGRSLDGLRAGEAGRGPGGRVPVRVGAREGASRTRCRRRRDAAPEPSLPPAQHAKPIARSAAPSSGQGPASRTGVTFFARHAAGPLTAGNR